MALIETTMEFRQGTAPGATFRIASDGVPLTTYVYDAAAGTVDVSETTSTTDLTPSELASFLAEFGAFERELTHRYLPSTAILEDWSWEMGRDDAGELSVRLKVGGEPLARINWSFGEEIRFKPRGAWGIERKGLPSRHESRPRHPGPQWR